MSPWNEFQVFDKASVHLRGHRTKHTGASSVHAGVGFSGVTFALLKTWNSFQGLMQKVYSSPLTAAPDRSTFTASPSVNIMLMR